MASSFPSLTTRRILRRNHSRVIDYFQQRMTHTISYIWCFFTHNKRRKIPKNSLIRWLLSLSNGKFSFFTNNKAKQKMCYVKPWKYLSLATKEKNVCDLIHKSYKNFYLSFIHTERNNTTKTKESWWYKYTTITS